MQRSDGIKSCDYHVRRCSDGRCPFAEIENRATEHLSQTLVRRDISNSISATWRWIRSQSKIRNGDHQREANAVTSARIERIKIPRDAGTVRRDYRDR